MMAVAAGGLFGLAMVFAPRYGLLGKLLRRRRLTLEILSEDVLALLFRSGERAGANVALAGGELRHILASGMLSTQAALIFLRRRRDVERDAAGYRLSEQGRRRAQTLVRSHRLWEQYLAGAGGVAGRHLHENAEQLEHFTDDELRRRLAHETASPSTDPHGAPIPPED